MKEAIEIFCKKKKKKGKSPAYHLIFELILSRNKWQPNQRFSAVLWKGNNGNDLQKAFQNSLYPRNVFRFILLSLSKVSHHHWYNLDKSFVSNGIVIILIASPT